MACDKARGSVCTAPPREPPDEMMSDDSEQDFFVSRETGSHTGVLTSGSAPSADMLEVSVRPPEKKRKAEEPQQCDAITVVRQDTNSSTRDITETVRLESQERVPRYVRYIIRTLDGSHVFNNPGLLTTALRSAYFAKYVVEGEVRPLGRGAACILGVPADKDEELDPPLEELTRLGQWPVKCWRAHEPEEEGVSYGKIGPIALELTEEDIKASIRPWGFSPGTLLEVKRLTVRGRDGNNPGQAMVVRLKYRGPLPEKVLLGYTRYSVGKFVFQMLRCYDCLRFGHGVVSCRNKVRCLRCSGCHLHKPQGGTACTNAPYCFYCRGAHRPDARSCPKYREAMDIHLEARNAGHSLSEENKRLRGINPVTGAVGPVRPSAPKPQSRPREDGLSYAGATNHFSVLPDLMDVPTVPLASQGEDDSALDNGAQALPQRAQHRRRAVLPLESALHRVEVHAQSTPPQGATKPPARPPHPAHVPVSDGIHSAHGQNPTAPGASFMDIIINAAILLMQGTPLADLLRTFLPQLLALRS